jgi:DNA replication and repair protein RecF
LFLRSLSLINFKNYVDATLQFSSGVNCFTGNNGSGKTNIIDAIYYLSVTKSYFNLSDSQNIKHGEQMFVIQGEFDVKENKEEVFCGVKLGHKKQVKHNGKEYDRLSDHIGLFPVVMVAPVDHVLITDGSEDRRRFMDSIISQVDKRYLDDLIAYNKVISHRNAFLKQNSNKAFDGTLLEVWNERLVPLGQRIMQARTIFTQEFLPFFENVYAFLSDNNEQVSMTYQTQLHDQAFENLLHQSLQKDLSLQYTCTGVHKDDLVFKLGELPLKKVASQGQQKTFLVSLKIAQFQYLFHHKKTKPVLLLDDIFDKLDDHRVQRLMQLVSEQTFGQIFITDTHPERLKKIFDSIHVPVNAFSVSHGEVIKNKE